MPNDCIDFGSLLKMRFIPQPQIRIKPRPFTDFPVGSEIVLSSSDECRGISKYTRIEVEGVPAVLDENGRVQFEDPTKPWWFAPIDIDTSRHVKKLQPTVQYSKLPVGGVFKYEGFVCLKRHKGYSRPFVPFTNQDVSSIPNVWPCSLVEYIGDVIFTEV